MTIADRSSTRGATLLSRPTAPGSVLQHRSLVPESARIADLRSCLVETVDDAALWERWTALEGSGIATAFQSRPFIEPLMRRLAPALGRCGLVVEVADCSGPILAAAFTLHRRSGMTFVELADCGMSDYAAPIFKTRLDAASAATVAAVERAVLAALPPHDVLLLKKMPQRIGGCANPFAGFAGVHSMWTGTRAVDAGDVLAGGCGALREGQRKARRILREGGRVRRIVDHDEALAALESLFAFRAARAERDSGRDVLDIEAVRDFYREVIGNGLETGFAVVHEIAAADRLLGIVQGFVYRGRFHGTLMGFDADDPKAAAVSPGLVGVVHALADHAEAGGTTFDFGAGEEPYKSRFGGVPADYCQVTRSATARGLASVAIEMVRCEGRRVLRKHPTLAASVRRWRRGSNAKRK